MSSDFLEKILQHKRQINDEKHAFYTSVKEKLSKTQYTQYNLFKKQISQKNKCCLIAEIKKASPSKGMIRQDFDIMHIAKSYADYGADAISVLTEDKYFLGKPGYVKKVSDRFKVPVLTKDFVIDEGQIYEARYTGSSAILLIVAILDNDFIKRFMETAARLDLDCLIEVHNKEELDRALECQADIIGINHRNLHTFEVDIGISKELVPLIPEDKVVVAESGIDTHEDIKMLTSLGVNAVLIGESFMKEDDIIKKIKEVMKGES